MKKIIRIRGHVSFTTVPVRTFLVNTFPTVKVLPEIFKCARWVQNLGECHAIR